MMSKTKEQRLAEVHQDALTEFDRIWSAVQDERRQCVEDRRFAFVAGAQWDGDLGQQFQNRPKLEMNKSAIAMRRLNGEYRNNPMSPTFISRDGRDADKLADLCAGMFRADMRDSNGPAAVNNAWEEGCAGGMGAARVMATEEDEDTDEDSKRRLRIMPIFDADTTVFFDIDAKDPEKRDARVCFVLTAMTRTGYEREWGDDPNSWPHDDGVVYTFDWSPADIIYVAEYFVVEKKKEVIYFVREEATGKETPYSEDELDADNGMLRQLIDVGALTILREKKVERKKVHKYIMSGGKVLEDCGIICGKSIPVVPFFAERRVIGSIERCQGMVRITKDAQRLFNTQMSKLMEISATSTTEKPIFSGEQINAHKGTWSRDNIEQWPFLPIDLIRDSAGAIVPGMQGPLGYTKSPNIPQAVAALLAASDQNIKEMLGNPMGADTAVSNVSTETALLANQRVDSTSAVYLDNFSNFMKRLGEVWLEAAKDVYVEEERMVKTVGPDGKAAMAELKTPGIINGKVGKENDLSRANFDVVVEVGPSSQSKRQAMARSVNDLLRVNGLDPTTQQVLAYTMIMSIEFEGSSSLNGWARNKLVRLGAVQPTEEEAEQLRAEAAQAKKDPQAQYLESAALAEEAKAAKARADTIKTVADSEKARAETQKIEVETIKLATEIGQPVPQGLPPQG